MTTAWLIDTSVWIDWMKQGQSPTRWTEPYLRAGALISCGLIRAEVIRGIRKPAVKTELNMLFDLIPEVALTAERWRAIAEMGWRLDRSGSVLPLTDLIIGCCALYAHAEVVTHDPHFSRIPGLKTRKALPGINALPHADT